MSQPFIGEIRMFGGNFAPVGWAFCDGSLVAISENDTLFNLIGTTYGGDGQQTFGLPDLQGRAPVHQGQGSGITQNYILGEKAGTESVTVAVAQLPSHTHPFIASTVAALSADPTGNVVAAPPAIDLFFSDVAGAGMNPLAILPTGGGQSHNNVQPFQAINFIISLFGIYPTQ